FLNSSISLSSRLLSFIGLVEFWLSDPVLFFPIPNSPRLVVIPRPFSRLILFIAGVRVGLHSTTVHLRVEDRILLAVVTLLPCGFGGAGHLELLISDSAVTDFFMNPHNIDENKDHDNQQD